MQHPIAVRPARSGPYLPWGMLAAIDLHGMRTHGGLALDRFGDDELEGWSAMQFIETSSITLHADEVFGRCFVDVFSCRPFEPDIRPRSPSRISAARPA
jgi:hypothetical protein